MTQWEEEYRQKRKLQTEYLHIWAAGAHLKADPQDESAAVLVVISLNCRRDKELLAIKEGYCESFESWRDVL